MRVQRGRCIAILVLFALFIDCAEGQNGDSTKPPPQGNIEALRTAPEGIWPTVRRLILPREISLVYDLRTFISVQKPLAQRSLEGDLRRLDAIYIHAVYLAEGDPYLALLALSFATLPYHTFPARIPLLDIGIIVPVSTESHVSFERRMANLPGLLLPDSPRALDRDKLPHFFGSAWLQCVTRNPALVEMAGEMLELGEEVFKLEGSRDERDIKVNALGAAFGIALQRHEDVLPSDIFKRND
ncbi:MAG: hypothetical protein IH600_14165 [Bacteroidetes bacterium]|nr:hypothetical protein [Bacteroidota bacterium]